VILEESLATQTFTLTVHSGKIDTHPLSGRFLTSLIDWHFLIIALIVKLQILVKFSYSHFLFCDGQQSFETPLPPTHTHTHTACFNTILNILYLLVIISIS